MPTAYTPAPMLLTIAREGRRVIVAALLLAALLPSFGAAQDEGPVATVDGVAIARNELVAEAGDELHQVELDRLQCQVDADRAGQEALENALERVVRRHLFELEAEERGVTVADLTAQVRASITPVETADVDRFYEENKARIRQPKEQIAAQIEQYLEQQRVSEAEDALFEQIKEKKKVEYLLEPLRTKIATEGYPTRGSDGAAVTIVEFSDFECPYCRRVLPTLQQAEERYGDRIRIVYRHFPLSIHPHAQKAAEASMCADDQGKFWEMHDLLFAEQQSLGVDDLKVKAEQLGLDGPAFAECLDSGAHTEDVLADARAGVEAGVSGTPTLFVNGRYVSGAVPLETLAKVVDDELRRAAR